MKKLRLIFLTFFISATAFAQITLEKAIVLACEEADRVHFQFETSCEDEFYQPDQVGSQNYIFSGVDISGDCGIHVLVNKVTGKVLAEVSCN